MGPTIREPDGLALSSRNAYLSPEERNAAAALSGALREAAAAWSKGERDQSRLRQAMTRRLRAEPLVRLDYAEVVDPTTFQPPGSLGVVAAYVGKTRLIDNHDLSVPFDLR
jgi:pantoate--beta-alanine ligase